MHDIGRPTGLIGYDTDINMERRREGKAPIYRIVRPRTLVYVAAIAIVGSIMLYALATRSTMDVNVLHERNPLFVKLSDGGVRNDYTVRLLNKGTERSSYWMSPASPGRPCASQASIANPTAGWPSRWDRTTPAKSGCRCRSIPLMFRNARWTSRSR